MSIDRRQLQCFVEVASLGSINKAAMSLNVSQSALSRRIQQLEHTVGVALFRRTTTGVELTEQGSLFREHAAEFDWEFDRLKRTFGAVEPVARTDKIRLGMVPSASNILLNRLVIGAATQEPEMALTVAEASKETLLEDIARGLIDLAITSLPIDDPRLRSKVLWQDQLFLVAPQGRLAAGVPKLADLPFVFCSRNNTFRPTLSAALRRLGIVPARSSEVTPSPTVKRLVRDGACFSILPYSAIFLELGSGQFDSMPIPKSVVDVGLIWRRADDELALSQRLLAMLEPMVTDVLETHDRGFIRPAV